MNLGDRMRNGAVWMFLGNTGSQLLNFSFGVVLARLLAPDAFGMLLTIQIFTGLASFVSGGGMGQALVRAEEASREDYDIVFTLQLGLGAAIYALFFTIAPWFADWYDDQHYTNLMRVAALSFLFRPFYNIPGNMLYRAMRYRTQSLVGVFSLIVTNITTISLAFSGFGVWSLVLGGIAGSLFTIPVLVVLARWRPRLSTDFARVRSIVRYGMFVTMNDVVHYVRERTSTFILSRTLGPASVGLYNKGDSLARMPHGFITGSVYHVLFRSMAAEQSDLDKCRYLLYRSVTLVAVYATPFYVGLAWIARPLVSGVYGDVWADAAVPLALLTVAWPFWLMENLSGAVLAAHSWLQREFVVQVSTFVLLAGAVWFGAQHGLEGVAAGVVGASVFSAFAMHRLAIKCLGARWSEFFRALVPAMPLNGILALVLWLVDLLLPPVPDLVYVMVMVGAGGMVYGLSFLFIPIAALATEQDRWKARLRLGRVPA